MNQKKVLIISRSFTPGISPRSFRTTELVKEFSRQGHLVTLLTHKTEEDAFYQNLEKEYNIVIKDLGKNILHRIRLGKNMYVNLFKRALARVLSILFEYPDIELVYLVKKALRKEKNYDLLISIAVPHTTHWGVALSLKKDLTKVWVADCGDPYMGTISDSFGKLFYFKYVEKWWCRKVDYITVPLKGAIEAYYSEFRHKIKIIPQGFKFDEIEISNYRPNEVLTFAYSGLLIPGVRDPKPIVDYLESKNINYKFILYNKQKSLLNDLERLTNGRVERRDYIKRKDLLKNLSTMDFLISFNNKFSTQVPSKLIDYFLTKRPILTLNSYNFDKDKLDQFINRNYINRHEFENINIYKIENVVSKFLSLCK